MSQSVRFVGINFDHMHIGDLLRQVNEHPCAEIAGICDSDPTRMESTIKALGIPAEKVFTDVTACLEKCRADAAILCPSNARHADYVEKVAPYGVNIIVEKPFATSLEEADRMIAAVESSGKKLMINWPLRWYPSHQTTKRVIDDGLIGEVTGVNYYDGNRGPLRHGADKVEFEPEIIKDQWWYKKAAGGGSLQDYLGYGVTLGTWFFNGKAPLEIMTVVDEPEGLEVDEHSITIARYDVGLSKYETRWGTYTDPWTHQPQPKCGFVITGSRGTIASYDYESTIRVQTDDSPEGYEIPVDEQPLEGSNPIGYFVHRIQNDLPIEGPISSEMARTGQRIVDTACKSALEKRAIPLLS